MATKMDKQQITKSISAQNRDFDLLKKHFSHCFDKDGNFDFNKLKKELSQNEAVKFSKESYGMDWLGKSYARLLASDAAKTLLKEDEEFNRKAENKNSENLLIKGDNLEVLKHLSNAYYEKIKMIYIDPPYNTGSDGFVYQDDRKFRVDELSKLAGVDEEKAQLILDFTQSKSNSHSAWLTFIYPRLYIAKQLLKDDGVIFVSIDDNEVAQLRLLMNEIFGEENFEGHIHWRRRHNQPNDKTKMLGLVTEHILAYSKNKEFYKNSGVGKLSLTGNFSNSDGDPRGDWASKPWKVGSDQGGSNYNITSPTGKIYAETWMGEEKTFKDLLADNRIIFPNNGKGLPRKKYYKFEREEEGQSATNWWSADLFGHNQKANEEMTNLFDGKKNIFSNPKPTKLIKNLILLSNSQKQDFILDFFAGSGTTADAVMQLNAEDDGNRKFILVQIPEEIDKKKNKTAYDFVKEELKIANPTIFDITQERIIRSAQKIKKELEADNDLFKQDISTQDFGFKIFETISNETGVWEDYNLEADEFDPQIKLFDESNLSAEDLRTLLITWKTNDNIPLTKNLKAIDLAGYTGYYFNTKLYLVDSGFKIENLKKLLTAIDMDKTFNPATVIAFGYNFESKVLRELAENVKSYANKKHIDIDFITRY